MVIRFNSTMLPTLSLCVVRVNNASLLQSTTIVGTTMCHADFWVIKKIYCSCYNVVHFTNFQGALKRYYIYIQINVVLKNIGYCHPISLVYYLGRLQCHNIVYVTNCWGKNIKIVKNCLQNSKLYVTSQPNLYL